MKGKEQVVLMNTIIQASSPGEYKQLSAYRAIKIAKDWVGKNTSKIFNEEQIQNDLNNDPICKTKVTSIELIRKKMIICRTLQAQELDVMLNEIITKNKLYLLSEFSDCAANNKNYNLPQIYLDTKFWELYFSSRTKYEYSSPEDVAKKVQNAKASEVDLAAKVDVYLKLRSFIPEHQMIDEHVATEVMNEFNEVPDIMGEFPPLVSLGSDTRFFDENFAVNEIGRLLKQGVGEKTIVRAVVDNILKGKTYATHSIIVNGSLHPELLQDELKRLLEQKTEHLSITDLMIYSYTGSVFDSYNWLHDILNSPRFRDEAKDRKEDVLHMINLAHKKGYISDVDQQKILKEVEEKYNGF